MPVHILTSLSGAPGVTSTALTWAQVSTRPTLVIEVDPAGGSPMLCIAWQGAKPHTRSVLDLAHFPAHEYVERIWELAMPLPQNPERAWLVPTVGTATQMRSLQTVWSALGEALAQIGREGVDVLVDLGRLGSAGATAQLWSQADTVLVFTDTTLQALNSLAVGLPVLQEELRDLGAEHRLAVVPVVGNEKGGTQRPYGPREIHGVLEGVPVLAGVARDAKAAGGRSWGKRATYPLSVQRLIRAVERHSRSAAEYLSTTGGA